jgi:nitrite reductase/ring-hydroxylating ferredoxin subunit
VSEQRAASLGEVAPGTVRLVEVNERPIVLARTASSVYACAALCAHRGGPLAQGRLSGTRLTCPWHGWSYDVRTGQCLFPGRGAALATYPVRIAGDDVWVTVP